MSNTSPARSSLSTTAIAAGGAGGGGGGGGAGGSGSSINSSSLMEDFHYPSDLITIQDSKDEAMLVLKTDLKAALDKEVKSLDENNWMFEAPRSRIHLLSRPVWPRLLLSLPFVAGIHIKQCDDGSPSLDEMGVGNQFTGVFLEKKMGMIKNTERGPKRMNF